MIREKIKLVKSVRKFVTRICDECGKEEKSRMAVILDGRKRRGKEIDLCRKCSCSRKYKLDSNWPKNEKSHLWKGGRRKSSGGLRIHISPGKWVYEHRLILENYLNRKLLSHEIVHHIDMDKDNNKRSNLYLCEDRTEHRRIHSSLELLGYKLLGNKIWFDYEKKKYVLYETKIPEEKKRNIELDIEYNIHIFKRNNKNGNVCSYQIYNEPVGNGKYRKAYVHVEIIKKILNRNLYRNEVIHHLDGNGLNNLNRNLVLMTVKKHISCHRALQNRVVELMACGYVKFKDGVYYV